MWYFLEIFTHLRACLLAIIKAAKPGVLAIMKAAKPWSKTKIVCGICDFRKFSKSQKLARKETRAHWTLSLRRLINMFMLVSRFCEFDCKPHSQGFQNFQKIIS